MMARPRAVLPVDAEMMLARLDALMLLIPLVTKQPDDGFYRPYEVARLFRVTTWAVQRWAQRGDLAVVRTPGGRRRFAAGPVNELLRGGPC